MSYDLKVPLNVFDIHMGIIITADIDMRWVIFNIKLIAHILLPVLLNVTDTVVIIHFI